MRTEPSGRDREMPMISWLWNQISLSIDRYELRRFVMVLRRLVDSWGLLIRRRIRAMW